MPGENILDWSITAASNANADSGINFLEGQARASLNDSMRSVMAAVAKNRNLMAGTIVTTGTANAQAFSSGMAFAGTTPAGFRARLKVGAGLTNTLAMTLQLDTCTAMPVKTQFAADVVAADFSAGA